jgi:hypothetical protein
MAEVPEVQTMPTRQIDHRITGRRRGIGTLGTAARVLVGGSLLGSVIWGHLTRGFHPSSWLLGLVGFPALLVVGQWLRARRTPTALRATGPVAHVLNVGVFLVLYLWEPTSDAALLFYGASMWLAAAWGSGGCEVLAASNWLLGRDDQVGCALFWPVDQLEHRRAAAAPGRPPQRARGAADTADAARSVSRGADHAARQ